MAVQIAPVTVEEFLRIPEEERIRLELLNGEVIERPMPRRTHEVVKAFVTEQLSAHTLVNRQFLVCPETEFVVGGGSRLIPDVAVVRRADVHSAANPSPFLTVAPILVVEVVSSESAERLEKKTRDYLANGVHSVWTLYSEYREVFVRHADGSIRVYSGDQILEDDALPGFRVPVSAFFEDVND